eukprot:361071-Chlamydomonas_euryale.AAC.2
MEVEACRGRQRGEDKGTAESVQKEKSLGRRWCGTVWGATTATWRDGAGKTPVAHAQGRREWQLSKTGVTCRYVSRGSAWAVGLLLGWVSG